MKERLRRKLYKQTLRGRAKKKADDHKRRSAAIYESSFYADAVAELHRTATECFYCGAPIDATTLHVEHIVPLARGGVNARINIAPSCPTCNLAKHANLPTDKWGAKILDRVFDAELAAEEFCRRARALGDDPAKVLRFNLREQRAEERRWARMAKRQVAQERRAIADGFLQHLHSRLRTIAKTRRQSLRQLRGTGGRLGVPGLRYTAHGGFAWQRQYAGEYVFIYLADSLTPLSEGRILAHLCNARFLAGDTFAEIALIAELARDDPRRVAVALGVPLFESLGKQTAFGTPQPNTAISTR
ncbi:HNH endonuclease [Methylocystis sp.]|uniref:HNH endonuclease n=1 Tax=Methylocystis sp. TaxID=1911079 RepID=UPI003DA6CE26